MTRVYADMIPGAYLLRAEGHATGSTEVCAAVSGLLYALAGYLENAAEEGSVTCLRRRMESADVFLHYTGDQRAEAVFAMAVIGLKQLEKQYPELVQVEVAENF